MVDPARHVCPVSIKFSDRPQPIGLTTAKGCNSARATHPRKRSGLRLVGAYWQLREGGCWALWETKEFCKKSLRPERQA